MKLITRSRLAILVLISAMLACSLPGTTPSLSVDDQAATIIAKTLQAQVTNVGGVPTATKPSITPTVTPLPVAFAFAAVAWMTSISHWQADRGSAPLLAG